MEGVGLPFQERSRQGNYSKEKGPSDWQTRTALQQSTRRMLIVIAFAKSSAHCFDMIVDVAVVIVVVVVVVVSFINWLLRRAKHDAMPDFYLE